VVGQRYRFRATLNAANTHFATITLGSGGYTSGDYLSVGNTANGTYDITFTATAVNLWLYLAAGLTTGDYLMLDNVSLTEAGDFSIGDEGLADFDLLEIDHLPARPPFFKTRVGYGYNPNIFKFNETTPGATPAQAALIQQTVDLTDGVTAIYFANSAPGTANERDLWHDTDDGLWYKRIGGVWVLQTGFGALGDAILSAAGAQATADGKVTTYYTDSTPGAPSIGDLWIKPSENPKLLRRWSGSTWDIVITTYGTIGTGPTTIAINADSTGVVTDALPLSYVYQLNTNGVAVASGVTWTYKVLTGKVNGFTNASGTKSMTGTGNGTFTLSSLGNDNNSILITATAAGGSTVGTATVTINKVKGAPPVTTGTGGSGSSQTSGFTSFSGTSYVVISNTLTASTGASDTQIDASIGLQIGPSPVSPLGQWNINVKLQRNISGTWTDQGSVISEQAIVADDGDGYGVYAQKAAVSATIHVTGLTANTSYDFRLVAEIVAAGSTNTTRTQFITGSWSVT
jgi:hypothetical protein